MSRAVKRPPVDPSWATRAFCKYENPDKWDMDQHRKVWRKGRRHCIFDCTVRIECLRMALQTSETVGVVRGGILFDVDQQRKKKSQCLLCGFFVAPQRMDKDGKTKLRGICYVCKRYAPCLRQCGRLVQRQPYVESYYCNYCAKS